MSQPTQPRGRFLQWFHGEGGAHWGTDPGEYSPEAVAKTLVSVARVFGPGRYFGLEVRGWENVPEAPATNEPPDSQFDPHECPRREAAAQQQLRDFLEDGTVNQYCDGICEGLRQKTCG